MNSKRRVCEDAPFFVSSLLLGSLDFHRNVITACDKMLTDLNPEVAEKQKQEQEISTLKGQMQEMSQNMAILMAMNKQLMEQLGVSETAKNKETRQ